MGSVEIGVVYLLFLEEESVDQSSYELRRRHGSIAFVFIGARVV